MQSKPCERKRLRLCKEKQDPTVVVVVCCGFDAPELCVCVLKCVWYFFPGCLLAAAWSCANNSLSLNIFILLSASSHALWASDWWVHIEGYRRPYQFCSDVSSSMARQYFLAQRKMFTMIKKCKLKKQKNNVKLLVVFLWSPFCLHYTDRRVQTVEKGLVCDSGVNKLHRCESDVTVWQRAVRKEKTHDSTGKGS